MSFVMSASDRLWIPPLLTHFMLCQKAERKYAPPGYLARTRELAHPLDLQQHNCLGFSHPALRNHWRFEGNGEEVVVPVEGQFRADHGEVLRDAALAGIGIILQPVELVRDALADGRLVRLLPAYRSPSRPMHILFAADRRITPKLRSFLDFAVGAFDHE